jgi:hypothetical protein
MSRSRNPLQIDSGRVFRWSFLGAFLLLEGMAWRRIGQRLAVARVRRVPILRLAIWSTWRATVGAAILAVMAALAAMLLVRLVLRPLLDLWLRPAFDPSAWMFHLSAGESPAASVPARWKTGGMWRPGALVLTGRRIWFMPASWGLEPWSITREDFDRVEAEPPALVRYLPVRHWPDLLHFTARTGDQASFAVADPDAVLAWFAPPRRPDTAPPGPRVAPQGVFDA